MSSNFVLTDEHFSGKTKPVRNLQLHKDSDV